MKRGMTEKKKGERMVIDGTCGVQVASHCAGLSVYPELGIREAYFRLHGYITSAVGIRKWKLIIPQGAEYEVQAHTYYTVLQYTN